MLLTRSLIFGHGWLPYPWRITARKSPEVGVLAFGSANPQGSFEMEISRRGDLRDFCDDSPAEPNVPQLSQSKGPPPTNSSLEFNMQI